MVEMRKALSQWGHKISEQDLGHLMSVADVDGDGLIDYNEFVASTMHISKLEKEELLQKAFAQLDRDGSGSISVEELSIALKQFGVFDDAAVLLATADKNGAGTIDYLEFCAMMREKNGGLQSE